MSKAVFDQHEQDLALVDPEPGIRSAMAQAGEIQRLEAMGQLTAGVAHEFNNILTVILGNLGFLEKGAATDAGLSRRLQHMRSAAERGANLTSQLLAFARRQRLEPKAVDLNESLRSFGDLMRSTMGGSVGIEMKLRPDIWQAFVDATQVELAILNLILNARDAMKLGGTVLIETDNVQLGPPTRPEEPRAGDYVMIAVRDTGIGMSDDVLTKCFEPFFTTKEVGKGSGLGLSQVLGFVKQSGGGIKIETASHKGTVVSLYLPRASGMVAHEDASAVRGLVASGRRPFILVVDDDAGVRDVTASMLREAGYMVEEAGSGEAALEILDREPAIELVIADVAMPGMNGLELAHHVNLRRSNTLVLFATGYVDAKSLAQISSHQIISKPFDARELAARVQTAIDRRQVRV
jgi:CheY-like chemotaxis protein